MTITDTPIAKPNKTKINIDTFCRVIAIWGPAGSTGKSTIALNLAYELSNLGKQVLLIDADTYNPSLTQLHGITEPTPGIPAIARLIRQGRFDLTQLDRLSITIKHRRTRYKLIPGLPTTTRWPEVTPDSINQLLTQAKSEYDVIVIDLASPLEPNLSCPESSTTRNSITRSCIETADQLLVILKQSPNSIHRYLQNFAELNELQKQRTLVINFSTRNPKYIDAIKQLTKEVPEAHIPEDYPSLQLAESEQLPLALSRRKSPSRTAISDLANKLLLCPPSVS
jgi:MinD-like ATPase involved in chromosome partitioning or flagellar assembly